MVKVKPKKLIGGAIFAVAAGYIIGLLTAPRSGKRTRDKYKQEADNSVSDIEKQLKSLYGQTQELIDKLADEKPKLDDKLKAARDKAVVSQNKIKHLLSALHGNDSVDDDLLVAIKDAKAAFKHLGDYVRKS